MSKIQLKALSPNKGLFPTNGIAKVISIESRYVQTPDTLVLTTVKLMLPVTEEVITATTFNTNFTTEIGDSDTIYVQVKYSKEYNNYKILEYKKLTPAEEEEATSKLMLNSPPPIWVKKETLDSLVELFNEFEYPPIFKSVSLELAGTSEDMCKAIKACITVSNNVLSSGNSESLFIKEYTMRKFLMFNTATSILTKDLDNDARLAYIMISEILGIPLTTNTKHISDLDTFGILFDKYVFNDIRERKLM